MKRVLIVFLSVGWLVPTWLAVDSYLAWQRDVVSSLSGRNDIDSFPHFSFSRQCFEVGVIWLAAAIICWSWRMTTAGAKKEERRPNKALQTNARDLA